MKVVNDGSRTDLTALNDEVQKIRWYHTIDLGNGIRTRGVDDSPKRLKDIGLPQDLTGKTVLDIGAWDGFFSFEAERRGAKRVLATDYFCWSGAGWGSKRGFELARRVFDSHVEDREIEVLDLSPDTVGGPFDVVLCLGVLYHMRHPLLALERVSSVTGRQLILDTQVDMLHCRRPAMAFYPDRELNDDETNWIGPNPPAVIGMLKTVGFHEVRIVYPDPVWLHLSFPARIRRAWKLKKQLGYPFLRTIDTGRMVFHAFR